MGNKFVVVDLETTGNSPKKGDRIIQVGAVIIEDGRITGQYTSLVNPGQPIPAFIEELTGISDEMVNDAPAFSDIAKDMIEMLDGAFFVAHNVFFDLGFLQEELQNAGFEGFYGHIIDTVELSRILFPTADGYKLSDLAAREGISHDRPHQADSDAYVTAELLLIMLSRLNEFPHTTVKSLCKLSAGLKSDLYMLFDEALQRKERELEELPQDLEIMRGIALKRPFQLVKTDHKSPAYPYGREEKQNLLAKALATFEVRNGQLEMMDQIFGAFEDGRHAMIEAGTGIGKTLAYLVPAVFFSKIYRKTIVVSTFTTQLQHQLLVNDLPKLRAMFDFPIKAVLLKGRNHYINLARFEQSLKEEDDNYDTTLSKMQIIVWLTETETGDIDELNLSSGGMIYWNKIKNGESTFIQAKHWDAWDFYLRARKEAENADLVITNHSMLLSDLNSEGSYLPEYEYAVLDEAHQFEKVAGRYFGKSLDYLSVRLLLNQLGQYEQGHLFHKLEKLLVRLGAGASFNEHTYKLNEIISGLQYETDQLFKAASLFVKRKKINPSIKNRIQIRLPDRVEGREWQALYASAERFSFMLRDVVIAIEQRFSLVEKYRNQLNQEEKLFLEELFILKEELASARRTARDLILDRNGKNLRWIETDLRAVQNFTTISGRPVDISDHLKERFFEAKSSVVLTSATLTVEDSFKYIKQELGIGDMPLIEVKIPSPFHYQEQVELIVPDDLPEIKTVIEDEYIAAITEHIISIAEATEGRMLTLFTSHDMLRKTYELIKESGLLEDFALIAQGITAGSRSRLTRNFQRFDKAILFGTSSFWEGVDIPGEDLSCLIIVRLPFSPPGEPLTEAKCEHIRQRGGNPFSEYSLPEAVLRFKQGFGRLVRTSTDKGIVFVFDRRVLTTSYGRAFLQSIPPVPVRKASIDKIIPFIQRWL